MKLIPINKNFIILNDINHRNLPVRININYIVSYRASSKSDGTMVTCKASVDSDIAPIYVYQTPEQIDNMIATSYIMKGDNNDSIN